MVGPKKRSVKRKGARDLRMDNQYMAWVEEVRFAIKRTMERSGVTVYELSEDSGRSVATIRRFLSEDADWKKRTMAPRVDTLEALTRVLGIPFGVSETYLDSLRQTTMVTRRRAR